MTRTTLPPPSTHPTDKALPPETSLLLLTRLTSRIEHNLHTPTSCASIEVLRRDSLRRERVCGNVTYATKSLQTLEKSLPRVMPPERRLKVQVEVARLRGVLSAVEGVLEEVAASSLDEDEDEDEDAEEDLLETPEGEGEAAVEREEDALVHTHTHTHTRTPSATTAPATATQPPGPEPTPPATATLRNRHHTTHAPPATTTGSNPTLQAREQTLTTHQTEQETLTDSLVSLATQLKTSSQAFQTTLDSEKSLLNRAVDGLDRTSTNMDAAERRMGMLRRMTEGKGWWGRMMLYGWIFAGWVLAVLIVFVGPKVRF